MKLEFIMFIRKYVNNFIKFLDMLAFREIQKVREKSYRERMERKTNVKVVTKGEIHE